MQNHLCSVLICKLSSERLSGEDLADLCRHEVLFVPTDVNEGYVWMLQGDLVL